jgi:ribonuclease-3
MGRVEALRKFAKQFRLKDLAVLENVFVHSSFLNEKEGRGLESNERLEFLGDAVLSIAVSHILFEMFPEMKEGDLTRLRARLVNREVLARLSSELGMGELMLLGKGERLSGGAENPAILADAFEALAAAVYLDGGWRKANGFARKFFIPILEKTPGEAHFDYKPILQEITQKFFKEAPSYSVVKEEGPPHRRRFTVEVKVAGETMGEGAAFRKKDAEQAAAKEAIAALEKMRRIIPRPG